VRGQTGTRQLAYFNLIKDRAYLSYVGLFYLLENAYVFLRILLVAYVAYVDASNVHTMHQSTAVKTTRLMQCSYCLLVNSYRK